MYWLDSVVKYKGNILSNILDNRLLEVGYFLSRRGIENPPEELNAESWKEAYLMFYSTFGKDKTEKEFQNSLKNLRDHFDSHLNNSRTGWMDNNSPQQLSSANQEVFNRLEKLTDRELWDRIRPLAITSYKVKVASKKNLNLNKQGAKYFSSEFSGVKKAQEKSAVSMNVKHGLIVDELKEYIEKKDSDIFVYNTQKIDLISELNNSPLAIYEVKTSADTQSVYTAVGQLFMHSVGLKTIKKYIVLPEIEEYNELVECLKELNIEVLWFTLDGTKCKFKLNKTE